jgi:DNA-binding transcriptional ArsR family regulator
MARIDNEELVSLLAGDGVAAGDLARTFGVTRQAIHHHLAVLRDEGLVRQQGQGRAARWVAIYHHSFSWTLGSDLAEDLLWREVRDRAAETLGPVSAATMNCLTYGTTEMLNNAIDHSNGSVVALHLAVRADVVDGGVVDDGIGAFRNAREHFSLATDLDAIAHIAKGKQTTAPAAHSGQGLFFTSKVVDHFQLEANGLVWKVDNLRDDAAIGSTTDRAGTTVRMRTAITGTRRSKDVFDRFTEPDDLRFDRTTIRVALGEAGEEFVSRSEAKRLVAGLDKYSFVVLDFAGVREVGQGFVDEIFRVWARANPEVTMSTANASPAVEYMLTRGLRD